jgi:hypothetical protein
MVLYCTRGSSGEWGTVFQLCLCSGFLLNNKLLYAYSYTVHIMITFSFVSIIIKIRKIEKTGRMSRLIKNKKNEQEELDMTQNL